jgi:hypothetical protein
MEAQNLIMAYHPSKKFKQCINNIENQWKLQLHSIIMGQKIGIEDLGNKVLSIIGRISVTSGIHIFIYA